MSLLHLQSRSHIHGFRVFNCDLYLGSSRMTLWSDGPRGGRGFKCMLQGCCQSASQVCYIILDVFNLGSGFIEPLDMAF